MVCILMTHEELSLQAAVNRVGTLCKQTMDSFLANLARVPYWDPDLDRDVWGYIQGLQNWIVGSLHWSFQTYRYFGPSGPYVKRALIVELLPPRRHKREKQSNAQTAKYSSRKGCFSPWMQWVSGVLAASLLGGWHSSWKGVLRPESRLHVRESLIQTKSISVV